MSKPAARVGDMHTCPMVTPGMPPVPHVGGPIMSPGDPTVLIAGMPAARQGDMCTCVGPPDSIATGSPTVLIGGIPAARMGDPTVHGGVISVGCPTVLIGDAGGGGVGSSASELSAGPAAPTAPFGKLETSLLHWEKFVPGKLGDKTHALDLLNVTLERSEHGGKVETSALKVESSGTGKLGGATHRLDVRHEAVELEGKASRKGVSAHFAAEAQSVKHSASAFIGNDPNNPFVKVTAGYEVASVSADADLLLGSDGDQTGIEARARASADEGVGGNLEVEVNIPIPFTNWSISFRGKKSADVGAGAHIKVDHRAKRAHIGAAGLVAQRIGVPFDFDISIGRKYQSQKRTSY